MLVYVYLLIFVLFVGTVVWTMREGLAPDDVYGDERSDILAICKREPQKIEYVYLLQTYGKEVVCDLKLIGEKPVRIARGVEAAVCWMKLKAAKEGVELPNYLLINK